jgi:hypothetical protein
MSAMGTATQGGAVVASQLGPYKETPRLVPLTQIETASSAATQIVAEDGVQVAAWTFWVGRK